MLGSGLETALHNGASVDDLEPTLAAADIEVDRLTAALRQALPPVPERAPEDSPEADWDAARELIERLEGLLATSDSSAIELFSESAHILRPTLGARFAEVETAMLTWDFVRAIEALHAARNNIVQFDVGGG